MSYNPIPDVLAAVYEPRVERMLAEDLGIPSGRCKIESTFKGTLILWAYVPGRRYVLQEFATPPDLAGPEDFETVEHVIDESLGRLWFEAGY